MDPVLGNKNVFAAGHLSPEVGKWDFEGTSWLTPDSILAYVGAKLRGLDEQIHSLMEQERGTQGQMDLISVAQANMQGGDLGKGDGQVQSTLDSLDAAINSLPQGSPARDQLQKVRNDFASNANDGIGAKERSEFAATIGNASKTLSQASEMSMIRLNSVVSMRQAALQMSSNLVNTVGQMTLSIVQNTGR